MNEAARRTVETGYDRVAERYLATKKEDPATLIALGELTHDLSPAAAVLDLGCGAGVPATRWLARRFAVTGVDVSARQLELARQHVPAAAFLKADMADLRFRLRTFDAILALYSIFHVPRTEQPALLGRIHRWLKPGRAFLATWAIEGWEGEEDWEGWGAPMWWSNHDRNMNLRMLRNAGFDVESAEARADGDETWLWILARKRS